MNAFQLVSSRLFFFNFAVQTCVDEAITRVLVIGYIIRECKLFMINSHIPDLYPCQQNIIVKSLKICVEYRILLHFLISVLRNKDLKIKKAVNVLRTNKILQQTTLSNDKSNGNANQDKEKVL